MCGIAGVVGPGAEVQGPALERMLAALIHRGPDGCGSWVGPSACLGTRRLAIVDPERGHQPIRDQRTGTMVVANGEIYGHRRLRADHRDYRFGSGSDIEMVAARYGAFGDDFVEHLPGTFALAVWDPAREQLTLARDPFGERPLYWARSGGLLVFASEPDALRASGLVQTSVDREVLALMLRQGYVPPGRSIWAGIESLPPASVLRWHPGGEPEVARWWWPPEVEPPSGGFDDPVAWFRSSLDAAVADQLVADVEVGAFLSGGVDSSTVAALAARHHRRIAGFTFDMPGGSELPYARAVADLHQIDLHVFRPDGEDLVGALDDVARVWGEPLGDSSTLPTLLLSRFVRDSVKVALTGDGADELLGGYLCWARSLLDPLDPIRSGAEPIGSRAGGVRRWLGRSRPVGPPSGTGVARRYGDFRSYFSPAELEALGLPGVSVDDVDLSSYQRGTADDIARFDLDHYLPGDILVKTDRASMAASLEVRSPFLDRRVAEGCLRLPASWKVDSSGEKLLLREACGDLLPDSVLERPKQGFGSPMQAWLRDPSVAALVRAELSDPNAPVFELLDEAAVRAHSGGTGQQTWSLLAVALWWRHRRS